MASYHFVVLGEPVALKRHKHFQRGKFRGTYDPSKSDKADFIAKIQENAPKFLIESAIELTIYAHFGRPQSHFRTGKFKGELKKDAPPIHSKRPDIDNILKFVMDSLTGVFWKDDNQIYKTTVWKLYDHEKPRVEVFVNTK